MRTIYVITITLGAALLFAVQPLVGRLLLPRLGGSPMVWNTCMVFFQVLLLAGYTYAHLLTKIRSARRQVLVHGGVLAAALLTLPIGLPAGFVEPSAQWPVVWLLGALGVAVGLPFLVVSTGAPLLQRWFATTDDPAAHDPYFLYAASNAGSLAALLGYPLLVEPLLGLADQRRLWSGAMIALAAGTVTCGLRMVRRPATAAERPAASPATPPPGWRDRLRWMLFAFVPSSLMLGSTLEITTDVAAVPLLWVAPLAIYLLTFVLAFLRRPPLGVRVTSLLLVPVAVAAMTAVPQVVPVAISLGLNLALLFLAALMCHGQLAASRPEARHLTLFYLAIAAGGALGGVFNTFVAPVLFDGVFEYPLVVALAVLLRPRDAIGPSRLAVARWGNYAIDLVIVILVTVQLPFLARLDTSRPTLFADRSFFGVHRVWTDAERRWIRYDHGTTCHGLQDATAPRAPQSYYHGGTGIGRLYDALDGDPRLDRVAVLGLGAGSLAARAHAGQRLTFYEIDPLVVRVARDETLFTYLRDSAADVDVVVGDGRLSIAREPDGSIGMLVLDAFTSDAIPVHLLTAEALALYERKLRPDGVLVLNISNRHVDLRPLLVALADGVDRIALEWTSPDGAATNRAGDDARGKFDADWAVLVRPTDATALEASDAGWHRLAPTRSTRPWTDDYSNLVGSLRWW